MKIRKAKIKDLSILNKHLPAKGMHNFHKEKIREQEDRNSLWLIAWKNNKPVGHMQIRFNGIKNKTVKAKIKKCLHMESLGVKEKFRRQGIGTVLIKYAEKLAKKKKFKKIGLAVGKTDNPEARTLYENLGYKNSAIKKFIVSWNIIEKGKKRKEKEVCVYLIKRLR